MGISASSLLDETKSNYIKGQAEAQLKEFSPHYRRQYSVAYFNQVQDELDQRQDKLTQLLIQRPPQEAGEVLYEENILYFDDTRRWRERYVVVRASYCLECYDSFETFTKGMPPRHKLLPTGGTVLTTEEKYMAMVDKCFPDETNNVKEEFAPPLTGMPGQFPVYLRLPYRRDSYFCFRQEARQAHFLSILSDCVRHQNQDFLKRKTCEVQAFLKAVQLYRQEKGRYESWDMLIGSDVRVLANLVMEELLPCLEKDMLPRLKAKKTERKRVWFATVEAAYILVQERLLEGLSALKEECRAAARQHEVLIHSDMDQILSSRTFLEGKLRASVLEPAEKFCGESVQPYLASILEELMGPISTGFQEARQLSDSQMDQLCQDFSEGGVTDELKQALVKLSRPNLLSCYQRISSLQEKLLHLQERFGFSNTSSLVHSTQIDLQQLMENSAHTFEQLMVKAKTDHPDSAGPAMDKVKHRVLKQYDYDSSTVRKRIFQDALVAITLPHVKKNLAPTCKTELQGLEQFIFSDHSNFLHLENVYEGILLQTLDKEVGKVVTEAAILKKHNLLTDSRDLLSQSSRSSLSTPPVSAPNSPVRGLASPTRTPSAEPSVSQPASPRVGAGPVVNGARADVPDATVAEEPKDKLEEEVALAGGPTDVSSCAAAPGVTVATGVDEAAPGVLQEQRTDEPAAPAEETPAPVTREASPAPAASADSPAEAAKADVPAHVDGETVAAEPGSPETPVVPEPTVVHHAGEDETAETVAPETETPAAAPSSSPKLAPELAPVLAPELVPVAAVDPAPVEDTLAKNTTSLTLVSTGVEAGAGEGEARVEAGVEAGAEAGAGELEAGVEVGAGEAGERAEAGEEAGLDADSEWESIPDSDAETPSAGEQPATTDDDAAIAMTTTTDAAPPTVSSATPSSGRASAQSEPVPSSDIASPSDDVTEETAAERDVKASASGGDERISATPDPTGEAGTSESQAGTETQSSDPLPEAVVISNDVATNSTPTVASEASGSVEVEADAQASASSEPSKEAPVAGEPSGQSPRAMDCIQEIRDLVVEVIEVEEMVQRYPDGVDRSGLTREGPDDKSH